MIARVQGLVVALAITLAASPALANHTVVELAGIEGGEPVTIEVAYECIGENPIFTLVNNGSDWTRVASIEIVLIDDDRQIFLRSMRMKAGQKATFRLPTKKVGQGEFGLILHPSWYARNAGYDARINCS